ncbi:hypothetical protein KBD71_01570 [Candidatus Woesebacteria bacterium]|nr:hypothetical protein [Candidatus Woesebacteria bacterium]
MIEKPLQATVMGLLLIIGGVSAWKFVPAALLRTQSEKPDTIAMSHPIVSTARKTNSWFSSAYTFPTQPLFSYPGAFRISQQGVEVSYPNVTATEKLVAAPFTALCRMKPAFEISTSTVKSYGDWNVTVAAGNEQSTFNLHLMSGSPVSYLTDVASLSLNCTGGLIEQSPLGVIVRHERQAILFQAEDGSVVRSSERDATLTSSTKRYRIVMLPTESQPILERIATLPWVIPTHTQASFRIQDDTVLTTYQIVTPDDQLVLFTTWPHHKLTTENPTMLGEYQTVLGTQRIMEGTQFTTSQPLLSLPEQFKKVTSAPNVEAIKAAIQKDTQGFISGKNAMPTGVYFKGTWIGSLTTLVQLADLYDMTTERDQLLTLLERVELESLTQFRYDEESSMMIATNPEFGNEFGNDHHFHYAYYIRAAAVLLTYKPELLSQLQPRIEELIADVATWEDTSNRFPRLRMFSVYEGHAWADGRAQFADGNNEESSSESLNTWYSIAVWGQKTNQPELTNRAQWLFSQDLAAIKAYWFAQDNPFPSGYLRPAASLIWGGKREFATWFSADPMHVYGIQWLPITPASSYLRTITTLPTVITSIQQTVATPATHEWGDLYTAVLAQVDPQQAQQQLPMVQSSNGLKLQSLLLQAVYQETE